MEQYEIADFADAHPHELSGGMRQRAALIRTLAGHPTFFCWMNLSVPSITRPSGRLQRHRQYHPGTENSLPCW